MLMEKPQVNRATKDILARCMATEDIRVIHDAKSETAWFDTENRVLCLPVWEDMSNAVYDMLVGHEVSHALHTPAEGCQDFVGDGKGSRIRHMFVNIVEDARIERMIKDKFPGLKRDFAAAYGELHDRDLFELANRTIELDTPLIDRLNLEFKLGLFGLLQVPFSADEKQYVTRMAATVTFDDVVTLAKELYEKHQDELEDEDEDQDENGSQSQSGEGSESQDGDGESQSQSGEGSETSESTDGAGDDAESQDGEDSGQSQADDTDDGESAESGNDGEPQSGEGQQGLDYDDYQSGVGQAKAGSTQNSFEQGVNNLRDNSGKSYEYHTIPTMKIENCVVDYKEVANLWENFEENLRRNGSNNNYNTHERYVEKTEESNVECREFLQRTKSTVAQMVQHFQMKQAADADKRTEIAKTGVLDTVNMINYRWSEDIFVKNEVHADGKNHGIVMYLDWSGSMNGIIKDTVEQLVILTQFCQKVNIPFDVYAFSSKNHRSLNERDENGNCLNHQYDEHDDKSVLRPHGFSLIQYLSSDMKTNEYKSAVQKLYYLAKSSSCYNGAGYPSEFGMGCTPLNESVMCAFHQVPAFQAKHNVQIVNTVFLTDGDGYSMGARRGYNSGKSMVHDPKTRKDYEVNDVDGLDETATYLRILQERTGTNIIGIRLHNSKHIRNLQYKYFNNQDMSDAAKSWSANNFVGIEGRGYDKLFIVRGNLRVETEPLENIGEDASYTKLKNAFMKGSNNQKSSRVIASQMVDIIAN